MHEPPPASTVADRLKRARRRRFVGRAAELELFRRALAAPEPPFSVLWIHGPGGVGQDRAARRAGRGGRGRRRRRRRARPARDRALAAGVHGRAGAALGLPADGVAAGALGAAGRSVLLLDTFEAAVGLEDWLRRAVRPGAAGGCARRRGGRTAPGEAWRRDPGWRRPAAGGLACATSGRTRRARCCAASGVAEERQAWMLELSHGHPLALSLLVDVLAQRQARARWAPLELGAAPDVVRAVGGGLPGRRAEPAPPAGAGMRRPTRGCTTAGLMRPRLRRARGRRAVRVAARAVVRRVRPVRGCSRTTSRAR